MLDLFIFGAYFIVFLHTRESERSELNVLRNRNVEDVTVTVIGGDVNVNVENTLNNLNIEDGQVVNVEDALNNNVVQVAVAVLGSCGNLVAQGSDALNL